MIILNFKLLLINIHFYIYLTMAFDLYITNQRIRWIWSDFQEAFCIYESPEDGHRSGPKYVVEVIHITLQILLWMEVCKKCLIGTRATGCITQKLIIIPPFSVSRYKISPYFTFSFTDRKSVISLLNYHHLKIFLSLVFVSTVSWRSLRWGIMVFICVTRNFFIKIIAFSHQLFFL
jgi:hypothetical protein